MEQLRPVNASMGMMLETVSHRLLAPGEAHHRCPDKVPKGAGLRPPGKPRGELGIPFHLRAFFSASASHRRTRGRSICDS